jgi:hypothetical protein
LAAIIIPGQSGTYRHLHGRVTDLLAESGLNAAAAGTGSSATLTAAMNGVPTLVRELNAELRRAGG